MPSQHAPHPAVDSMTIDVVPPARQELARSDNCCSNFGKVLRLGNGKSGHPSWKGKNRNPIDSHQLRRVYFTNAALTPCAFKD